MRRTRLRHGAARLGRWYFEPVRRAPPVDVAAIIDCEPWRAFAHRTPRRAMAKRKPCSGHLRSTLPPFASPPRRSRSERSECRRRACPPVGRDPQASAGRGAARSRHWSPRRQWRPRIDDHPARRLALDDSLLEILAERAGGARDQRGLVVQIKSKLRELANHWVAVSGRDYAKALMRHLPCSKKRSVAKCH